MIRVIQQRDKCIGCNACVEADPNRWRMSMKDGKCTLVNGQLKGQMYNLLVGDEELPQLEQAIRNCPVKIIRLIQL